MQCEISEVIDKGHGVTLTWYADNQIALVQMTTPSRESIDTVIDAIRALTTNWEQSKPYLTGLELSARNLMTPYSRERFTELSKTMPPHLTGRYGLIVPRGLLGEAIRMFFNREVPRLVPGSIIGRSFTSREQALAWLTEGLSAPSDG